MRCTDRERRDHRGAERGEHEEGQPPRNKRSLDNFDGAKPQRPVGELAEEEQAGAVDERRCERSSVDEDGDNVFRSDQEQRPRKQPTQAAQREGEKQKTQSCKQLEGERIPGTEERIYRQSGAERERRYGGN